MSLEIYNLISSTAYRAEATFYGYALIGAAAYRADPEVKIHALIGAAAYRADPEVKIHALFGSVAYTTPSRQPTFSGHAMARRVDFVGRQMASHLGRGPEGL